MKTIIQVGIAVTAVLGWQASSVAQEADADEILALAEDAGRWIALQAPANEQSNLGSGIAGEALFFSALYRATDNTDYLSYARQRADRLLLALQDTATYDGDERRASLYNGAPGIGVALMQVWEDTEDPRYAAGIERVLALLDEWRIDDSNGAHWSEKYDDLLFGNTGTVLFLADAAKVRGDAALAAVAHDGARYLVSRARCDGQQCHWLFRHDKDFNLPNFSHGTAGVAYTLATVAELVDEPDLRVAASRGLGYLQVIAKRDDGQLAIPYGWGSDSWVGLYEFGWAHGLAGTALALQRLMQTGIDVEQACTMLDHVRATLASIGLPGAPDEPFAEPSMPLDYRFGRAGVLSLLSELTLTHPHDRKAALVRDAIVEQIISSAVRDEGIAYWEVEAPAFMGGGRQKYTGLLHGAAGIGLVLLRVRANLSGEAFSSGLPDDPFGPKTQHCSG